MWRSFIGNFLIWRQKCWLAFPSIGDGELMRIGRDGYFLVLLSILDFFCMRLFLFPKAVEMLFTKCELLISRNIIHYLIMHSKKRIVGWWRWWWEVKWKWSISWGRETKGLGCDSPQFSSIHSAMLHSLNSTLVMSFLSINNSVKFTNKIVCEDVSLTEIKVSIISHISTSQCQNAHEQWQVDVWWCFRAIKVSQRILSTTHNLSHFSSIDLVNHHSPNHNHREKRH